MSTIGNLVGQLAGGGGATTPAAATQSSNNSNSFGNILNSILNNAAPIIGSIKGNPVSTVYVSTPSDTTAANYMSGTAALEASTAAKEDKPKTGLIIGIVAAVLLLGVILFFVFKK